MNRRFFITAVAIVVLPGTALAAEPETFTELVKGVAVGGHDAVSYFKGGEPQRGDESYSTEWKGANWRFASQVIPTPGRWSTAGFI